MGKRSYAEVWKSSKNKDLKKDKEIYTDKEYIEIVWLYTESFLISKYKVVQWYTHCV